MFVKLIKIRLRESDDKKGKVQTKKYNFLGKSARKKYWFNIDHEWLKEIFMTHELDLYKNYIKLNLGVIIQK